MRWPIREPDPVQSWYAWRPVKATDIYGQNPSWIWLERIRRRRSSYTGMFMMYPIERECWAYEYVGKPE